MGAVSGLVYDGAGDLLAGAIVSAYRSDTRALLGEAVTWDGTEAVPADPGADHLSLMLQFQGEAGTQTFVDSGPLQHIITPMSDINLIDTNPAFAATPTTASFYSVNSKRLLVPAHACFDLPGDFTLLARWRSGSAPNMVFFTSEALTAGTWFAEIMNMGSAFLVFGARGSNMMIFGPAAVSSYSWNEVLLSRSGSDHHCLVNGQPVSISYGNATDTTPWVSDSTQNRIGGTDSGMGASSLSTQLAEFAVYKGIALHTGAYTPLTRLRNLTDYRPLGRYDIDCGAYSGKVVCTAAHPTDPDAPPLILRTTPV